MIKNKQLNHISTEWLILCTRLGGWELSQNDIVESDFMGDSVESDLRDKSDVNETVDR